MRHKTLAISGLYFVVLLFGFFLGAAFMYYRSFHEIERLAYVGFGSASLNSYLFHKNLEDLVNEKQYQKIDSTLDAEMQNEAKSIKECLTIKWCERVTRPTVENFAPELLKP